MKFFYLLTLVAVLLNKGNPQDIGRNDGEPDYDPDDVMINLRDEGRNDGEPDYDPEGLTMDVRSEGRNDGEPDYDPEVLTFAPSKELRDAGRNEGEPDYDGGDDMEPKSIPLKVPDHPYRMLIPEEFKGKDECQLTLYFKIKLNGIGIQFKRIVLFLICLI